MIKPKVARTEVDESTPLRQLDHHKVNPANDRLNVTVMDQPGAAGACHQYMIDGEGIDPVFIDFQDGPIAEVGVNGLTHEVLLAILQDRLEGFQSGPYAHLYNDLALQHIVAAQTILKKRTEERMARGVEGTHTV